MISNSFVAPLHGLRGIAAVTVLVGHFMLWAKVPLPEPVPELGVALFFILSGYLMGRIYLSQPFTPAGAARYLLARFARIYPLFAVVVIAGAALAVAFGGRGPFLFDPGDLAAHLVLAGDGRTVWSVAVEFRFYLLFVPIWWAFHALGKRQAIALPCLLAAIAVLWLLGPDGDRLAMERYLHLFLMGLGLSLVLRDAPQRGWTHELAGYALPVLLAGYVVGFFVNARFYDPEQLYGDLLACIGCAALVAAAIHAPASPLGRVLSSPILVWLGEVSFGIYLLHRLVMYGLQQSGWRELPDLPLFVIVTALTLVAAWLANVLIERPAREVVRNAGESVIAARVATRLGAETVSPRT